jgi:cytochrome c oxidase subunit 3/cytochrome o ubiquinol oxidase subunit 3
MSHVAVETEPTSLGVDNRKLGVWTFIGSEVMFFSGLIVTYLVNRGRSVTGPYPHEVLGVPLVGVNTFVLICSSLTMVTALAAIERGNASAMRKWLIATAVLGLLFLGGQAFEFSTLFADGLSLSTNLFGATFFTLTGFHGTHVLIGVIWIVFVLARAFRGGVTQENHLAVELVGLYWHFVDVVWIVIFTLVYLL